MVLNKIFNTIFLNLLLEYIFLLAIDVKGKEISSINSNSKLNNNEDDSYLSQKYYRFEPYKISNERNQFVIKNFHLFSDKLFIKSINGKLECVFKKRNDKSNNKILFKYPKNQIITSNNDDYYYPLKSNVTDYLSKNLSVSNDKLEKLKLSLYLLFELKANFTEILYTMNKYYRKSNEINNYRNYLRFRLKNSFLVNYIHNLPLSNDLSFYSWSNEEFYDYMLTGQYKPKTKIRFLQTAFNSILLFYSKMDKNSTINDNEIINKTNSSNNNTKDNVAINQTLKISNESISSWISKENSNLFYSIYHYIEVYGFKIKYSTKDENEISNIILVPFLDICSHSNDGKEITFKYEKNNEGNILNYVIESDYFSLGEEGQIFSYRKATDLSNDNLLLNYGIVIKNNINNIYTVKFDIYDGKYKFLKFIKNKEKNTDYIKIGNNDMISATFILNTENLNQDLLKFLFYLKEYEYNVGTDNQLVTHKNKNLDDGTLSFLLQKSLKKVDEKSLRIYLLYYSTVYRNLMDFNSNLHEYFGNKTMAKYIKEIQSFRDEMEGLNKNITNLNNANIIEQYQNLFYYNRMHELINKRNIHLFNLENLQIIFRNMQFLTRDILNIQSKVLKSQYLRNLYKF